MRKWIAKGALAAGLVAAAGDVRGQAGDGEAQAAAEAANEIPLEGLPPAEKATAIDAASRDAAEAAGFAAWSEVTSQLVTYSDFVIAMRAAGADLSVGIAP